MTKDEFSQCVDSCGDALYGFCVHLTGSRANADDLFQDAFLSALEKVEKISPSYNTENYLIGIALRLWKNQIRKEARRKRIAGSESLEERQENGDRIQIKDIREENPEKMAIDKERSEILMSYVRELKPVYRISISLYYGGGKSIREIAGINRKDMLTKP